METTTVLTHAKLESIKRTAHDTTDPVLGGLQQQAEIRKRDRYQKKAASANRVSRWKNTLEADSIAKQNWLLQKEAEEEDKRMQIDKEEAAFQEKLRLATISRAEDLLYKESPAARSLRSSVLYSEVMETRKEQIKKRQMEIDSQRKEDARYHSLLMSRVSEAEEKEKKEKEARKYKFECIVRIREQQLRESLEAVQAQRRADKEEGDREKAAIAQEIEAERRQAQDAVMQKRVEMERMVSANQDLKAVRNEIRVRELKELDKCKNERETLDRIAAARKKLEAERFARKQCIRQTLIEKAMKDLKERITSTEEKEEKEYAEIMVKQDEEEEEKQRRRQKQLEDIEWSRSEARRLKQQQKSMLDKEAADLQAQYEQKAKVMAENEHQKNAEIQKQNVELKEYQGRQAKEIRNRKHAERLRKQQPAEIQNMTSSHYEERKKFMRMVVAEARQLQKKGLGMNLLEKNIAQTYGVKAVEELHQILLSERRAE